jgi:hypothetical protein
MELAITFLSDSKSIKSGATRRVIMLKLSRALLTTITGFVRFPVSFWKKKSTTTLKISTNVFFLSSRTCLRR